MTAGAFPGGKGRGKILSVDSLLRFKPRKSQQEIDRVLRYLIESAYENVPYYRGVLDRARIMPGEIKGAEELPTVPVTSKELLITSPSNGYLHQRVNPKKCFRSGTSGTSGMPITVYMSRNEALYRRLLLLQALRQNLPLKLPLTIADVGPMVPHKKKDLAQRTGLLRVVRLPATLPLAEQVSLLNRYQPHLIEGYPTCLAILAERLESQEDRTPRPRLVVTRGEVLRAHTRHLLQEVFRSKVADYYNVEEVGNIAWECPENREVLHVNTDACIVEIVDADGCPLPPGKEGRVVVTNLYNLTMPFIRYDLGDRGAFTDFEERICSCRTAAPSLALLSGRDDDYLYLPDGSKISPRLAANTVLNALRSSGMSGAFRTGLRSFQLIQLDMRHIKLRVVLAEGHDADLLSILERAVRSLHPKGQWEIEEVEDLPLEPSGKFKKVVSKVKRAN